MKMNIREKYTVKTSSYRSPDQAGGTWDKLRCTVLENNPDGSSHKIGEYIRGIGSFYATWEPFEQDGKAYALCSPNYTGTSVMALPSCEIVASEPEDPSGFCPTGFYVPMDVEVAYEVDNPLNGQLGFVCGCMWGDDSSWKVEFLDLSDIQNGNLSRDTRFGYLELPDSEYFRGVMSVEEFRLREYISIMHTSGESNFSVNILSSTNWYGKLHENR